AHAAKDNQPAGDKVQKQVVPVGDQVGAAAQNIKAGVVEGRHGVEQADADGVPQRPGTRKRQKAQRRAGQHKTNRGNEDAFDKLDNAAAGIQVHAFFDKVAAAQVNPLAHQQNDTGADRRNPKPADLDQPAQEKVSNRGEGIAGIHRNQAGHAD